MDQHIFTNMLRSLFNIDGYQLPELTSEHQGQFLRDPVRYFIGTDKVQQDAIFREVMKRQPSEWRPLSDLDEKREVLLLWSWPETDAADIIRIGTMPWKPWDDDNPVIKLDLDIGDACATFYTSKQDDPPVGWMPLPSRKALNHEA